MGLNVKILNTRKTHSGRKVFDPEEDRKKKNNSKNKMFPLKCPRSAHAFA
jgi:hypothetical protein